MSEMIDKTATIKNTGLPNVSYYESPIGVLELVADSRSLQKVDFVDRVVAEKSAIELTNSILKEAIQQLDEYFSGERKVFSLPLSKSGTPFQKTAWKFLRSIPYGETHSYSDQATAIGNARAVRAVAQANHNNQIAIIVPCHRVLGKNGSLTGYGGGIWRKKWLLEHEQQYR